MYPFAADELEGVDGIGVAAADVIIGADPNAGTATGFVRGLGTGFLFRTSAFPVRSSGSEKTTGSAEVTRRWTGLTAGSFSAATDKLPGNIRP